MICRTRARRRHRWRSPIGYRYQLSPAVLRTHRRGDLRRRIRMLVLQLDLKAFWRAIQRKTPRIGCQQAIIWKNGTGRTKGYPGCVLGVS